MTEQRALIAGASGLVGGLLVDELLARPAWTSIVCVGRRALAHAPDARLSDELVDFATLGPERPLPRAHTAFCCLGTTIKKAGSKDLFRAVDFDAALHFAQAAYAGGTPSFVVVTAHGASVESSVFYNRVKGELEQALRGVGFVHLAIAQPSLLLGDRAESRPGERVAIVLSRALSPLLSPLASRPIEARTVARALLAMAETPLESEHVYSNRDLHALGA